jgi:hypothetical protein
MLVKHWTNRGRGGLAEISAGEEISPGESNTGQTLVKHWSFSWFSDKPSDGSIRDD